MASPPLLVHLPASRRQRGVVETRPLFLTYLFVSFPGDERKTAMCTNDVAFAPNSESANGSIPRWGFEWSP
jgi:hypothetical protein